MSTEATSNLKLELDSGNLDPLQTDENGNTIIHLAALAGKTGNIAKELRRLNSDEEILRLLMIQNKKKETALIVAAAKGHVDAMKCMLNLISKPRRIELLKLQESKGRTALHMLICSGEIAGIRFIIDCVEPKDRYYLLTITDHEKFTAIHYAAEDSYYAVEMERMLENLSPEERFQVLEVLSEDGTALHVAVICGNTVGLNSMISSIDDGKTRFELLKIPDNVGETVLHKAVGNESEPGNVACVDTITSSLEPEDRYRILQVGSNTQATALHLAVEVDNVDVVKGLLDSVGSKERLKLLRSQDDYGSTAAQISLRARSVEVLQCLQQYEEEAVGRRGRTRVNRSSDRHQLEDHNLQLVDEVEELTKKVQDLELLLDATDRELKRIADNHDGNDERKKENALLKQELLKQANDIANLKKQIGDDKRRLQEEKKQYDRKSSEQEKRNDELSQALEEQKKQYDQLLSGQVKMNNLFADLAKAVGILSADIPGRHPYTRHDLRDTINAIIKETNDLTLQGGLQQPRECDAEVTDNDAEVPQRPEPGTAVNAVCEGASNAD